MKTFWFVLLWVLCLISVSAAAVGAHFGSLMTGAIVSCVSALLSVIVGFIFVRRNF